MRVLRVERADELRPALERLGLPRPLPALALVGGADRLTAADLELLGPLLEELAGLADRIPAAIVDGGTDAGVMRLVGEARTGRHTFPLVGVAVDALVREPGAGLAAGQAALEPSHTHVLLVPGTAWGDEVPWLAKVVGVLAGNAPSATVLVNGGEIAYDDAAASIAEGRPVVVVAGSGGAADDVAAAVRDGSASGRAGALAASGLVHVVDLRDDSPSSLVPTIERILSARS